MKPLGYTFLIEHFALSVPAPYKKSYLGFRREGYKEVYSSGEDEYFPSNFKINNTWQEHLSFAVKHEGINPTILKAIFSKINKSELSKLIKSKPLSVVFRRIWFFYEFLTGSLLPIQSLSQGNYDYALPPSDYFTLSEKFSTRARRQRLFCNLPGNAFFCPIVRLTKKIKAGTQINFREKLTSLLSGYPESLLHRANAFLYLKETKSSFAIEQQNPTQKRTAAFMEILKNAGTGKLDKETLIRLQHSIVDERYAESDFRKTQVYVGQSLAPGRELVHFVGVRPEDVTPLMDAFFKVSEMLINSDANPVIVAAVLSFAFVFFHPFEDGNGRLHRYIIHHVVAAMKLTPEDLLFPISAVLYKDARRYDRMLESFSKRLMPLVNYRLNSFGEMKVENDTADFYRFINFTEIVELFFDVMKETLETELLSELDYLNAWEQARVKMREVVDMPEKKASLFIKFIQQNGGVFPNKRRDDFRELSDEEVLRLSRIIREEILGRKS